MRRRTPIGALLEGAIAGAVGAGLQGLFFRATQRFAPRPPAGAFTPPEPEQARELPTETVARRLVEGLAQHAPLDKQAKRRAGELVHFGFGAAWGGLYGLLRASLPRLWSPAGLGAFALGVWAVSDNLIVPAFALGAWPQRNPLRIHGYYATAHLVYGVGVGATLAAIDNLGAGALLGGYLLTRGRAFGRRARERGEALVPRDLVEQSRHFAAALARRARDLSRS